MGLVGDKGVLMTAMGRRAAGSFLPVRVGWFSLTG
jgi:hypothetical protein